MGIKCVWREENVYGENMDTKAIYEIDGQHKKCRQKKIQLLCQIDRQRQANLKDGIKHHEEINRKSVSSIRMTANSEIIHLPQSSLI